MARTPKHVIIIDDENQEAQKEYLEEKLRREYDIHVHLIDTSDMIDDENGSISQEKLDEALHGIMDGKSIDLVLTDFELSDDSFSGIEVVKLVKTIRLGVPVIMYSGKRQEVLERLLGDYKNRDVEDTIQAINEFVSWDIQHFSSRNSYSDDAIKFLKKKKMVQVEDIFIQKLRGLGDQKFEAGYPAWRDKTLNEICDHIVKRDDVRYEIWMDDLIEQVVAYLTKITE